MERARDSGAAALSGKIVLVQDLRRGLRTAGFVLFLPVLLWDLVRAVVHELPHSPAVVYEVSPDELGTVNADPALLKQVITNLIGNALKFSRNAVGFDPRHAGKLFGVFERLHAGADCEGTGVGLAIVKQIVERHGGQVWADAAPGRGATFFFTLP